LAGNCGLLDGSRPGRDELEFRILGPLEVSRGVEVIEIAGPKQPTLLAVLLLNEPDQLDAARFERFLAEARAAAAEARVDLLQRASGLWRGPALMEFA
jgi:hypothetical protein